MDRLPDEFGLRGFLYRNSSIDSAYSGTCQQGKEEKKSEGWRWIQSARRPPSSPTDVMISCPRSLFLSLTLPSLMTRRRCRKWWYAEGRSGGWPSCWGGLCRLLPPARRSQERRPLRGGRAWSRPAARSPSSPGRKRGRGGRRTGPQGRASFPGRAPRSSGTRCTRSRAPRSISASIWRKAAAVPGRMTRRPVPPEAPKRREKRVHVVKPACSDSSQPFFVRERVAGRALWLITLPASCQVTPVSDSTARAPRVASMAQRPWISSHSRKRCRPNTSE